MDSMVSKVAALFKGKAPMPLLVGAGTKGLAKAAEKFDCKKHRIKFISYATWHIRASIIEAVKNYENGGEK